METRDAQLVHDFPLLANSRVQVVERSFDIC
jgi:hypothetical protein